MKMGRTIPALPAEDIPAAASFYRARLGFDVPHSDARFAKLRRDDAEIHLWAAGAVQAFGEDAGDSRFARAARTAEQVRMRDAVLLDRVGERLRDVLLAHHIAEPLWPIFERYNLIGHL